MHFLSPRAKVWSGWSGANTLSFQEYNDRVAATACHDARTTGIIRKDVGFSRPLLVRTARRRASGRPHGCRLFSARSSAALADITAVTRRRALTANYDDAKYYLDLAALALTCLSGHPPLLAPSAPTARTHGGSQQSRIDAVPCGAPGASHRQARARPCRWRPC